MLLQNNKEHLFIQKNSSVGFIKFFFLFREVVLPLFSEALVKHSLNTDLITEPLKISLPESSILQKGDVNMIIRAFHEEGIFHSANDIETSIGVDSFNKIRDLITINEGKNFQIPSYQRVE